MANLIFSNLEGTKVGYTGYMHVITLYFDVSPTDDEIKQACIDIKDDYDVHANITQAFNYQVVPTTVSTAANLVRVEIDPVCYGGSI